MESIVSFPFSFGQTCCRVHSARISKSFFWFAKVRQVLYLYFTFIPNFRVVENKRIKYRQKENVECLPLALSSKRHVIVWQTKAKRCIKVRPICAAQLACKNIYPAIEWLHIPELNCCTSRRWIAPYSGIKLRRLEMKRKKQKFAPKCFCAPHNH